MDLDWEILGDIYSLSRQAAIPVVYEDPTTGQSLQAELTVHLLIPLGNSAGSYPGGT